MAIHVLDDGNYDGDNVVVRRSPDADGAPPLALGQYHDASAAKLGPGVIVPAAEYREESDLPRMVINPDTDATELDMNQISPQRIKEAQHAGLTGEAAYRYFAASGKPTPAASPAASSEVAVTASTAVVGDASSLPVDGDVVQVVKTDPAVPKCLVEFELPGVGRLDACYHHVVVQKAAFVLVYDIRYSGHVFFPTRLEQPFLVRIVPQNRVYLVHSMGIQYSIGSQQHCCLLIEDVADESSEEQMSPTEVSP